MPRGFAVSAPGSGAGKTTVTLALMHYLSKKAGAIQPFKTGPDYIDPLFHSAVTGLDSVNLDTFLMSPEQVQKTYLKYSKDRIAIVEGVMGYYDGMDRGTSTMDVTNLLGIPVLLVLPAKGASHTLAAQLYGLLNFRKENNLQAVLLNHVSGEGHYSLIKGILEKEFPGLPVVGWVSSNLEGMGSRHLGLDLRDLNEDRLREMACRVLEHVDLEALVGLWNQSHEVPLSRGKKAFSEGSSRSIFPDLEPAEFDLLSRRHLVVVRDRAFSFVYTDNLEYLEELFGRVTCVSALADQEIPSDADVVYLPGGYVETPDVYPELRLAAHFRHSLIRHAQEGKRIYAECAGLLYLGKGVRSLEGDIMEMSGILPLEFQMRKTRKRLGYYESDGLKGHAFHYSEPILPGDLPPSGFLQKPGSDRKEEGTWISGRVAGTYLHTTFRNQPEIIRRFFLD